ncbi:MAG: tetratricopeptide repeat protein [Candidatus Saganbacteria bacterium]|nr:tetratricopeptide repeat protein [Candidatus Saganbacteria bacterium]
MNGRAEWLARLKAAWPFLLIAGLGALVYFKTLFFGLTFLDDNVLLIDNFAVLKNPLNLLLSFRQVLVPDFGLFYRPLSPWPQILAAQIGGQAPGIYHLTNLLLHLLAACLLFVFLGRLGYERTLALLGALFFAVAPALASAVAWIPGGIDVWLTVLVLAALIFFLDYARSGRFWPLFWHLVFFTLALLTKEIALVLLLICPLYFWLAAGRAKQPPRVLLWPVGGYLTVICLWLLVRRTVVAGPALLAADGLAGSLLNPAAYLLYFGKVILPFNLSPLPTLRDSPLLWGWLALCLVGTLLFVSREKRYGPLAFGLLWFILFLMPALVFSDPALFNGVALYEHRLYLPLIGVIIVLLEGAGGWAGRKNFPAAAGAVIAVFALLTFVHLDVFHDRLSFWEAAAAASPHHPLAHRNLGAMYHLAGDLARARREYYRTIMLNPAEPMVHNNLGLIYMNRGEFKIAEDEFVRELRLNPRYDNALFNLGLLYAKQGRLAQARLLWRETLKVNPGHSDADKLLKLSGGK